jgi:hypothetical protein
MNKLAYLDGYLHKSAGTGPAGGTLMSSRVTSQDLAQKKKSVTAERAKKRKAAAIAPSRAAAKRKQDAAQAKSNANQGTGTAGKLKKWRGDLHAASD